MRCPECKSLNHVSAAACTTCGLILIRKATTVVAAEAVPASGRRAEDFAGQKRRRSDHEVMDCLFCGGQIPLTAIRCRHCSEIVNDEFYRERARRVRSRINYSSWIAYLFGLAALLVLRPVGIVAIACGLLLSIVYYAIPVEPPASTQIKKRTRAAEFIRRQFGMERVEFQLPLLRNKKLVFVGTPLVAALIGYSANVFLLQEPVNDVMKQNSAYAGMKVSAHYKYWVVPGVVEYDLRGLSVHQTPIDVHTALLEFAKKVKERRYSRVDLNYQGVNKLWIDGASFQRIGQEYAKQNFDYVLYEFPRLVRTHEGDPLTQKSNHDALIQFHKHWYGNDSLTRSVVNGM